MEQDEILIKCFTCHNKTKNKRTRRRAHMQSLCRLFNLPSLPFEDQLLREAVFCTLCYENVRQIELLYRKLEDVKRKLLNFRTLLETQLTKSSTKNSPCNKEEELENTEKKLYPDVDPADELRTKIISKIQLTANDDSENKTDIERKSTSPNITSKKNDQDDCFANPNDDVECKNEIDWSPPASPLDSFANDEERAHSGDSEFEDRKGNWSPDSHNSGKSYEADPITVQSRVNTRRTRSQTALINSNSGNLCVKLEKETSCKESDGHSSADSETYGSGAIPGILNSSILKEKPKRRRPSKKGTKRLKSIKKTNRNADTEDGKYKRKSKKREKISEVLAKNYLHCTVDNCNFKFSDDVALNAHIKRYHEGVEKPYVCTEAECGKSYRYKSSLDEHMFLHSGAKPFMCEFCAKTFSTKNLLQVHTTDQHTKNHPFKCPYCPKGFRHNSILQVHLTKHTKDYQHICECGRRFSNPHTLKYHKKAHDGEFKCPHCSKTLSTQGSLDDHILTHTGLYPFKCSRCDFGASTAYRLKNHMMSHDGIKIECEVCKKKISRRSLSGHMKIHNPERQKKCICEQCGKAFGDNYKLKRHARYHIGEKPFQCAVCGKSFYTKDYLNVHMKYHEKSGVSLRNQTRKPRIWKHSVLPNPNIDDTEVSPDSFNETGYMLPNSTI